MNSMNKIVLITGGAGFIGSNLCERLVDSGNHKVFSLDNYFTGKEENHIKGVTYIKGNTSEINSLINFKPDYLYHLGEYSRVEQSFNDIELVNKLNISSIYHVLNFCKKNSSKLIYSGSSTKFGDGGSSKNSSPYSWSKYINSELVKNYSKWYGLNYAITYFYNVYGGREISSGKYATLIGIFTEKSKNNKKLTVTSPGTQIRNFTHIDDIVSALILIGDKGTGDNFGIGHHDNFSILEVAKMFKCEIEMTPEKDGNRSHADLVTEKTLNLGWKPNHNLKNYIKKIINAK